MRLKALKAWYNADHEGSVEPGQEFEASDYRGDELVRSGLAVAAVGVNEKIKVSADAPKPPQADGPATLQEEPYEEELHAPPPQQSSRKARNPEHR
jgi:hypothetical protein